MAHTSWVDSRLWISGNFSDNPYWASHFQGLQGFLILELDCWINYPWEMHNNHRLMLPSNWIWLVLCTISSAQQPWTWPSPWPHLTSFHILVHPIIHTLMFPKSIPNRPTYVIALDMLLSSVIINSITPIKPLIFLHMKMCFMPHQWVLVVSRLTNKIISGLSNLKICSKYNGNGM